MTNLVEMRECTKCGKTKPFSIATWHISRGVPCGNICKRCKAEGLRARRLVATKTVTQPTTFKGLPRNKLVAIANKILLVDRIDRRVFMTEGKDEIEVMEYLAQMSFDQAIDFFINCILDG